MRQIGPVRIRSGDGVARLDARPAAQAAWHAPLEEFPELACVTSLLPADVLIAAARRSARLGIGADRILIARGTITEDVYLHRFSMRSGIRLADLSTRSRADVQLSDDDALNAARTGILRIRIDGKSVQVISLREDRARRLIRIARKSPRDTVGLRLVSEQALQDLLLTRTRGLINHAVGGLQQRYPQLSAAPARHVRWYVALARRLPIGGLLLPIIGAGLMFPGLAGQLLALLFLAAIGIRLTASLLPAVPLDAPRIDDADLPIYSVVVALYREERSVGPLLAALTALDYPHEKLDIILVVEADDDATQNAIAHARPPSCVRVVVAPDEGPRTKPKALNVALPFARGRYVAIFDAEDKPDADQLRLALAVFNAGGDDLACVQARLAIENSDDSLITRLFAAEYAAQFDIVMPGYERLGLPWPLGGTSNHFDAAKLRDAGAWDAFNVTEDADLGLRFARLQYRIASIDSTTWEEAPITWLPWLKQRTRWMKGWMQTWWVHARHPARYFQRTGWRGMVARDLVIGGALLAALAYPVLVIIGLIMFGEYIVTGDIAQTARIVSPLHGMSIAGGLGIAILLKLRGLAARDRLSHAWVLLLTPLYWGMLSCAAWRALWQLRTHPHVWEKTEHGVTASREIVRAEEPSEA